MPTLDELDAQIRQLEDQKKQLVQKAKDDQLKKANDAIAALRAMGFNYRLAEMDTPTRAYTPRPQGTRRTGIREEILAIVKSAPQGISRADVLTKLNAKGDKSAEQSASNALAALKKAGTIDLANGVYKAK
jgi:hypothetical protein